ncbi:MAG TPA: signal peptide peptidase SppA [Thermodesulfobacteriota bacterium]|nr:signal peptide peptidase SppA [Deltaproteobacteria bacterium]HNR12651.1 signal peptide peptidase SppA [Thermodesulfobacteriota bacterium]HQO77855.1 signal peptide peptidase SppA [Thermodesulfobacteriota bacterium]
MARTRHPVLSVLIGLAIIFFVFLLGVVLLSMLAGGRGSIAFSDQVAVIPIHGVIDDAQAVVDQLYEYRDHRMVRAIVLHIDSPGGGVGPSQEIYREVRKVGQAKTVVASVGSMAASGGYYVACAAEKIVANPGAITGSIGVIMEYANAQELLAKIGLKGEVVKSGKYKDILSPLREMTEEEKAVIQRVTDDIHGQFISAVAEGRAMERSSVETVADGRIFTAAQAKELGLVDTLGTLRDAVALAADMAGIEGEPGILYPEEERSLLDLLVGKASLHIDNLLWIPYRFSYLFAS